MARVTSRVGVTHVARGRIRVKGLKVTGVPNIGPASVTDLPGTLSAGGRTVTRGGVRSKVKTIRVMGTGPKGGRPAQK